VIFVNSAVLRRLFYLLPFSLNTKLIYPRRHNESIVQSNLGYTSDIARLSFVSLATQCECKHNFVNKRCGRELLFIEGK